jgi:hypothetical protein
LNIIGLDPTECSQRWKHEYGGHEKYSAVGQEISDDAKNPGRRQAPN